MCPEMMDIPDACAGIRALHSWHIWNTFPKEARKQTCILEQVGSKATATREIFLPNSGTDASHAGVWIPSSSLACIPKLIPLSFCSVPSVIPDPFWDRLELPGDSLGFHRGHPDRQGSQTSFCHSCVPCSPQLLGKETSFPHFWIRNHLSTEF